MNFIFNGEIIDYDFLFNYHNTTILFLHGWGGNKNSFISSINLLKSKFNILTITIPTTQDTQNIWDMDKFCNLVLSILICHNISNIIIVCHSFGFRICSLLNGKVNILKLVITGGAGLKKISIFKKITQNNTRILLNHHKFKNLFNNIASKDYKVLSNKNKNTFKNVVNFNIKNLIKFNCPILLFWGNKDKETPLWIMKKIKQKNTVKSIVVKGGHFAYLTENFLFNNKLLEFIL